MKIKEIQKAQHVSYWQSAAIGAAAGIAQSAVNNQMNLSNAREMARLNFNYNEEAADNAMKRSLALWEHTQSPSAVVKQLKDAGLSPGILLGQAGIGGAASGGPQGEGDAGMNAPIAKLQALEGAAIGAQIEKTKAETKNIEEDTSKKAEEKELLKLDQQLTDKNIKAAAQTLRSLITQADIDEATKEAKIGALLAINAKDEAQANADKELIKEYKRTVIAGANEAEAKANLAKWQEQVFKNENWIYTDDEDESQGERYYKKIMRRAKELGIDLKTITEIIGDFTKIGMIGKMVPKK